MQECYYAGFANPSAAVALDVDHFIVADDEINRLCIYRKSISTGPVQVVNLNALFKKIGTAENSELDLEGACRIGTTFFWIGSHSTSRKGKPRPARHCLFALEITPSISGLFDIKPVGQLYTGMMDELAKDPRFARYHLNDAQKIPPKAVGGLSIEGLAATPDGGLIVGFRNPLFQGKLRDDRLVKGKAFLFKISNPFDILADRQPIFDDPFELDLKGLSIRDMTWHKKHRYIIVAGPYHDNQPTQHFKREKFQLYSWSERSHKLKRFKKTPLKTLNIEAAMIYPAEPHCVQLLSDDGKLEHATGFRSVVLNLKHYRD